MTDLSTIRRACSVGGSQHLLYSEQRFCIKFLSVDFPAIWWVLQSVARESCSSFEPFLPHAILLYSTLCRSRSRTDGPITAVGLCIADSHNYSRRSGIRLRSLLMLWVHPGSDGEASVWRTESEWWLVQSLMVWSIHPWANDPVSSRRSISNMREANYSAASAQAEGGFIEVPLLSRHPAWSWMWSLQPAWLCYQSYQCSW